MSEDGKTNFQVQRIYVKDVSFESPGAPEVFLEERNPKINVQLNNSARRMGESSEYEVEVGVTVTAIHNDKTMYLVEVRQAGIFTITGVEGANLDHMLGAYCPDILFPYLRQAVSELIALGSFQPFLLQPINFQALYRDAKAKRDKEQAEGAGEQAH